MLVPQQASEVRLRLQRIVTLAREIEAVPNFGADLWTMRGVDQKCVGIKVDCAALSGFVGTGDVLRNTSIPPGAIVIPTDVATQMQRHIQRIAVLAQAIEDVPNFGPDIWSMRKIDQECREIVAHCQALQQAMRPQGTGPG